MRVLVNIILLIIIVIAYKPAYTQSDFDLSQRWFNEAIYNPAATGNSFTTSVFIQARKQWLDMDGAPATGAVSGDIYLHNIQSALGFGVTADKIGFTNTYNARFAYAYFIPIGIKSALSLGLSASLLARNRNFNNAIVLDPTDPRIAFNNSSHYTPDFDIGIEYKGPFKFGVALRHIVAINSSDYWPSYTRNLWAYLSTRFNAGYNMSIEPTVSYVNRDKLNRMEAGMIAYFLRNDSGSSYNDRFWIGLMYRFNSQLSALVGTHLTSQLRIGYSFDYGFGNLSNLSKQGTHEIFISWQFNRIFYKESENCPAYRQHRRHSPQKKSKPDLYNRFF